MTADQVRDIIRRLAVATRFHAKNAAEDKVAEEFAFWMEQLQSVPYERALEAVRMAIETGKFRFMPTLSEFKAYLNELSGEGTPNAIPSSPSEGPRVDPYLLWRQDQLVAMSEEDYWRYLYEAEFRAECERRWQDQWAHMPDKPYQHREVRTGDSAR